MNIVSDVLNLNFIESIEIKEKPYFIKFSKYPGLRIKVNPMGRISYLTYGRIHFGGNPRTITHGTTKTVSIDEALDKHFKCISLLQKGLDPNLIKKSKAKQHALSTDFVSIAQEFIHEKESKKEFSERYSEYSHAYLLTKKLKRFHKFQINQINKSDIKVWYDDNADTPASRHNALRLMSSIFSYAITRNLVDSSVNPTKSFFTGENIYKPQARDRQLSLDTELPKVIYQLWDPLNENKVDRLTRNAIFLLLITGLKKSDVLNMRWEQIHSDSYIKIDKNKINQIIPITETIKCVLDDLKSYQEDNISLIGMDYIFFNKKTNKPIENLRKSLIKYSKDLDWVVYPEAIRKTFANICDRTNIPRSHFYQLLGLKKAYNPYETNLDAIDNISQLKKSLELVQDEIDKLAPMLIPGQMTKIKDFLYN